jgi:hypothetical protein
MVHSRAGLANRHGGDSRVGHAAQAAPSMRDRTLEGVRPELRETLLRLLKNDPAFAPMLAELRGSVKT